MTPDPTRHDVEDAIDVLEYVLAVVPEYEARRVADRAASMLRMHADEISNGHARSSFPTRKVGFHDRVPDMRNYPPHSWLKYRVRVEHGGAERERVRDYVDLEEVIDG